jgi:hypothetical protein
MKDQIITNEDDLEDKLREVWAIVSGDLLGSGLYQWMSRLEWIMEHEGKYYINPY